MPITRIGGAKVVLFIRSAKGVGNFFGLVVLIFRVLAVAPSFCFWSAGVFRQEAADFQGERLRVLRGMPGRF